MSVPDKKSFGNFVFFLVCRFDEVKNIDAKSSEKKVLAVLKKAQRCIELGLVYSLAGGLLLHFIDLFLSFSSLCVLIFRLSPLLCALTVF